MHQYKYGQQPKNNTSLEKSKKKKKEEKTFEFTEEKNCLSGGNFLAGAAIHNLSSLFLFQPMYEGELMCL